ncbi:hypothetical protein G7K_2887-t1 [Saitoella complicata NRRL Y-17804]|uniref:Cleft lip and palate transmembrane 1 n=2 Tax=Saitoella complicata (strain BCRC 22490 / CBS 7301 / JCM 7358 / NBRC 10748 / NRRL Y-17804) TaxID=698492 RepID=A0A0E9NFS3_SAICN|nr:hypothetical protein G7K_2887-t1 [Saitoella complicata NRRL Y-17804]
MPAQQAAAAPAQNAGGRQQEGGLSPAIRKLLNMAMAYFALQAVMNMFAKKATTQTPVPPIGSGSGSTFDSSSQPDLPEGVNAIVDPRLLLPEKVAPAWPANSEFDLRIYTSPSDSYTSLDFSDPSSLLLHERSLHLGDWNDERVVEVVIPATTAMQNNGSLYAHIVLARDGAEVDPGREEYDGKNVARMTKMLNRYQKLKRNKKTKNLLDKYAEEAEEEEEEEVAAAPIIPGLNFGQDQPQPPIVSYWSPNLTLAVIADTGELPFTTLPPVVKDYVHIIEGDIRDDTGKVGFYYPIVFPNEFWTLDSYLYPLNSTTPLLPLKITIHPLSWFKFQMYASVDYSFKQQAASGQLGGGEVEELKRVVLETNVWLLGITVVVSCLHSLFEFLAFKNDIVHWRQKKDNTGISLHAILSNVFMQLIIFLYLLDNNDNTSWLILIGQGFGILLEAWKITKAVDVRVEGWRVKFEDKNELTETERETKEYDGIAFKYLIWAAIPLLLAYAAYSLLYDTHKSWYSFVVTTLVGFVYTWGFLTMVPPLYINYRLKSVAHMSSRVMMYKFLNTFIDDLFAFVIKMPTLHRLACLRDDVVFFVYLWQLWRYRVDKTRVNEFGQDGEAETGVAALAHMKKAIEPEEKEVKEDKKDI